MSTPKPSTDLSNKKANPNEKPKAQSSQIKTTETKTSEEKSKADLRRERREMQENQRALKASGGKVMSQNAKKTNELEKQSTNKNDSTKPIASSSSNTSQSKSKTVPTTTATSIETTKMNKSPTIDINLNSNAPVEDLISKIKEGLTLGHDSNETSSTKPIAENQKLPDVLPAASSQVPKLESNSNQNVVFETASVTIQLQRKKQEKEDDTRTTTLNKSKLFHHFDQYKRDYSMLENTKINSTTLHPAFIKLGLLLSHDVIDGSSNRCISFLDAFKQFVLQSSFAANSKERTLSKDFESKLKPNINFLTKCRPLSISMGNAIKEMKQIVSHLPNTATGDDLKKILEEEIDRFVDEKILLAAETISKYMLANQELIVSGTSYARSKITNSDCVLVYGYSSLVTHVLLQAKILFPKMHVIVVDSRPNYKGKITLKKLLEENISCTYVLIHAVSFLMSKVTKVILGAHALLANGYVMSSIGSSQLALTAKSFNVPVVVCCETYKFCDKVQTDALVNNELGNPLDLLKPSNKYLDNDESPLADWSNENKQYENLTILNLRYDVTPPDLISCVVTDMGMLPCTSVPVVLRLKNNRETERTKRSQLNIDTEQKSI